LHQFFQIRQHNRRSVVVCLPRVQRHVNHKGIILQKAA
jgi:hypothetical protein